MNTSPSTTGVRPWWIKAGIQGTLSLLPQPQRWNRLFQRYVTRSIRLRAQTFQRKWAQALHHHANWRLHRSHPPRSVLELGTGWHPVVPCGLALLGVEQVYTLDVTNLVCARTLAETFTLYDALLDERHGDLPVDLRRMAILRDLRHDPPRDPYTALAQLGVHALVADARTSGLGAGTIDLFVSNNTLEHIDPATIAATFQEFGRLAAPGALMSHFIDMADHYAAFDPRITVYNFLRFTDTRWRLFDNELQHQNRLRVTDFRELHRASEWRLLDEENTSDAAAFAQVELAPQFHAYSSEDCMVYASWITSERMKP
jgi:hypothetical protein